MFFLIVSIITVIAILAFLMLVSYTLMLVKKYSYLSIRVRRVSMIFSGISFLAIIIILGLLISIR